MRPRRTRRQCRRHRCPASGGFSLLEVMVALAILAGALIILLRIVTGNVQNTNKAKLMTVATFLARAKIVEIEDRVLIEGFIDFDDERKGDFANEGYPEIAWDSIVERVRLPLDLAQQTQQAAADTSQSATDLNNQNPLQFMAGFMGGFMSTLIEPIRLGLEESVRRVTVRVYWQELGKPQQSFEVVTFLTDPSKLDQALTGGAMSAAGAPGAPGAAGATNPGQPPGQQTPLPNLPVPGALGGKK
ncbi:MAG: prepilin-type N-terminal cleavage/methylation domain-containing protein [Myxococcales bacterium]|nr:prepilin-type N-terminal cleavage/methylation domain-containing protein [Myxococcales bacterium]